MNPKTHYHPESKIPLFGVRLQSGDILQENDVYSSTSGIWQACPGLTLGTTAENLFWVRPLPVTNDEVIDLRDRLLKIDDPSVFEQNQLRDCDIALGVVRCKPETRAEAFGRVARAVGGSS